MPSLLSVVEICDNFRLPSLDDYPGFRDEKLDDWLPLLLRRSARALERQYPLGFLRRDVAELIASEFNEELMVEYSEDLGRSYAYFAHYLSTPEKRTQAIDRLVKKWVGQGLFSDVTGGRLWRNELYAIYTNPFGPFVEENIAFEVERSAAALFGVLTYGVHMTMYYDDPKDGLLVWVPTRSHNKQTWPGYLDNSVAGGIPSGLSPLESIVKECEEEASLNQDEVRKRIRSGGCVSYFTKTIQGFLQPEVQFVYDLKLNVDSELLQPKPSDGEVHSFELCKLDDCLTKMHERRFKPNCALVLADFLIRHGYVTPENEPHYFDILTRIHGRMSFERKF